MDFERARNEAAPTRNDAVRREAGSPSPRQAAADASPGVRQLQRLGEQLNGGSENGLPVVQRMDDGVGVEDDEPLLGGGNPLGGLLGAILGCFGCIPQQEPPPFVPPYVPKNMRLEGAGLKEAADLASAHEMVEMDDDEAVLEALAAWEEAASAGGLQDHVDMIKMVRKHRNDAGSQVLGAMGEDGIQGLAVILQNAAGFKLDHVVGKPGSKGVSGSVVSYLARQPDIEQIDLLAANQNAYNIWEHRGFRAV